MIQDVDETLRRLLAAELEKIPGCPVYDGEQITFDPPAVAEAVQDRAAHVNLYLHDVRENVEMRDDSSHVVRKPEEGIVGRRRGPVRLDLGYLVTVYAGEDPAVEHRLLAEVLGVLLQFLAAPEEHLAGVLEAKGPHTLLLSVAQPEHVANVDPPALWQALGGRLRPTLSLVATAPFDPFETKWTKAVREAVMGLGAVEGSQAPRRSSQSSTRVSAAGMALDQESAQPVVEVAVTVAGRNETATSDSRGFFCLVNLPPGPHLLSLRKRGYRLQEVSVVVPPLGRPEQWQPSVIALRRLSDAEWAAETAALAEAAWNVPALAEAERVYRVSLSGRLRFADGRPAAHLAVRAGRQRTRTDGDGLYYFVDLPPGEEKVFLEVPGRGEVEIATGEGSGVVALPEEAAPAAATRQMDEGG